MPFRGSFTVLGQGFPCSCRRFRRPSGLEWRPLFDGTGGAAGASVCSSVATMGVSVGYCLSSF